MNMNLPMNLQVQMEKTSNIRRKLTIRVPAKVVANRFERGLAEVQKTARLKGFRPGHAPLSVVKQFYGDDVRHRLYHNLIDESFQEAVREQKLMTVGRPQIEDAPEHKTGVGEHDHAAHEDKDLVYTATVEVMPEVEVKGYTGISLTREKVEITDEDVKKVVDGLREAHAELVPAAGGLVGADGKGTRAAKSGDHVDVAFSGGIVTDKGIDEKPGMKGSRVIEIGSESLIPGFEDNLIGMRSGETKTFRIPFPKEYHAAELAGKESEFTVTLNEIKEKKVPALDDEFSKQLGYESAKDLQTKAKDHLTRERTDEVERKLRSELVQALIAKNEFEVPAALIETQTRALAQDWAEELKRQGIDDATIQQAVMSEIENLKKRAESQVRASLILETIAKKENVEVKPEQVDEEINKVAQSMNVEPEKLRDFYAKNPGRKEDFVFRLRQESTLKFLLDKAKIKS